MNSLLIFLIINFVLYTLSMLLKEGLGIALILIYRLDYDGMSIW